MKIPRVNGSNFAPKMTIFHGSIGNHELYTDDSYTFTNVSYCNKTVKNIIQRNDTSVLLLG